MNAVTHLTGPVDKLLSRLDGVQSTGKGWRAYSPCDDGKSRSLSIAVGDDGRVILHDFKGYSAVEVVHAVGLELADLFEKPITSNMTPAQKRDLRERRLQSQWRAALDVLAFEATVVLMAVAKSCEEGITKADFERLKLAVERVADAREVLHAKH